jgi:hypothetical protein
VGITGNYKIRDILIYTCHPKLVQQCIRRHNTQLHTRKQGTIKNYTSHSCAVEDETISWKREMHTEFFTHNYYGSSIEEIEHGTGMTKRNTRINLNENLLKVDLLKYRETSERITLKWILWIFRN